MAGALACAHAFTHCNAACALAKGASEHEDTLRRPRIVPALCSACPGDVSACIGSVGLLGSDWQSREAPDTGPSVKGKKNLYVNPPRKGGCGYSLAERTIGGKPFTYMPDPYQNGRALGKELRKKARARIPKPFNSAPNQGNGLFTPNPFVSPPGPAYIEKPKAAAATRDKGKDKAGKKPFVPPRPPAKGAAYCTLSKVGRDYVPEPEKDAAQVRADITTHLFTLLVGGACCQACVLWTRHLQAGTARCVSQTCQSSATPSAQQRSCVQPAPKDGEKALPFKPCAGIKERLSMRTVNPYQYDARPPPDFTLFN
jgi:Domain of unknown function (DUF4586)